jgi:alkylation response protein AidB-like acyl-CoA dehydrogenase
MDSIELEDFLATAESWLEGHAERRAPRAALEWGAGSDRVSLFRGGSATEEKALVEAMLDWQRVKYDAGYGAIDWPAEYGGAGLSRAHADGFRRLEYGYVTPPLTEIVSISLEIEAPTILALGSEEQKRQWIPALRRGDSMCCQMFSEPGAGSDLGSIATRAVRDGDGWILDGQKVWTSGAQYCDIGYVLCRTDASAPRQQAFTVFLVPMDAPGVEVRPLRQMTGGANFNEVFFTQVRVPDGARLGALGAGWQAAMTTLGFERASVGRGGGGAGPDMFGRLLLTAAHFGRLGDPEVRRLLTEAYARNRMRSWTDQRARAALRASGVPGPEGSLSKLATTRCLHLYSEAAAAILGPAFVADTGEWGTYAWAEFACGVPGLRLGGGTDEIQKNTIAERALGLPREPRPARSGSSTL